MELSDWVNKITFSEMLFLPAIFDWNNPKKHVYCSFPTGFSGNLFFCYYWLKSDNVNPSPKYTQNDIKLLNWGDTNLSRF